MVQFGFPIRVFFADMHRFWKAHLLATIECTMVALFWSRIHTTCHGHLLDWWLKQRASNFKSLKQNWNFHTSWHQEVRMLIVSLLHHVKYSYCIFKFCWPQSCSTNFRKHRTKTNNSFPTAHMFEPWRLLGVGVVWIPVCWKLDHVVWFIGGCQYSVTVGK